MPRETKIEDKTMRRDQSTGKMVKSENYRNDVWNVKTTTVKRGGVVRKKIATETFEAIRSGQPVSEKSLKVEKFDRSGKLKKATSISEGKKVVTKPGKPIKERSINLVDRYRLNN